MPRIVACSICAVLLIVTATAQTTAIRVWKVGSPHTGAIPSPRKPPALTGEAARRGSDLQIEVFPADGFAQRFADAVRDGSAPDVVAFDNFGIMDGIVTSRGKFAGIGRDPVVRDQLIQVTSSFDDILAPARGWVFLFAPSANHAAARDLALRTPQCQQAAGSAVASDLPVAAVAAAYLRGDNAAIGRYADAERLSSTNPNTEPTRVGQITPCGAWGNDRLAFSLVNASYQAKTKLGHAPLLFGFRRTASSWRLLVASRDPISTNEFPRTLPRLSSGLAADATAGYPPLPALLESPDSGRSPLAPPGERFGFFEWQASRTDDVIAEIAEFGYNDDARLFLLRPKAPGTPQRVSMGQLWSTRSDWSWRVWSIG